MCKTLDKDPKLVIEIEQARGRAKTMSVEEYLQAFQWDTVRFQMDKPLKILGQKIQGSQKACDDRLKKLMDEQNEIKTKLNQLTKKVSQSFLIKDLGDICYE